MVLNFYQWFFIFKNSRRQSEEIKNAAGRKGGNGNIGPLLAGHSGLSAPADRSIADRNTMDPSAVGSGI